MYGTSPKKDDLEVQQERLTRFTLTLNPDWRIDFKPGVTDRISFRLIDKQTEEVLGAIGNLKEELWSVSKVADMSDAELKRFIESVARRS